ncbi:MAG: NAD-dependent epimerase/dehydratase family protein [Candidatus Thermoplasmatota archaeon]|nr:NAD-dependent epimerase/dehydratase family protein [Candidatus Thermoplasmatota archaeon]
MNGKKILITGSNGQLGSFLMEYLRREYNVIGLDIRRSGNPLTDKHTVHADIRENDKVKKLIRDVDYIVHTAAQIDINRSYEYPIQDADINILGTLNLLNAARNSEKLQHFIYVSSSAVYGKAQYMPIDEDHPIKPISPYGVSKYSAELYCKMYEGHYSLPTTCLRLFNMYGSKQDFLAPPNNVIWKFMANIKKNEPLKIEGDGSQLKDFVHVSDVAAFIGLILEKDVNGNVYNVGSGKPTSILDVARLMLQKSGKQEADNILFVEKENDIIQNNYADISNAKKLGYAPQISIERGIEWFMEQNMSKC